ncbi:MAG: ABC transporter ATP-binding protein [Alphaproteobacteria bacterium]|nr:ABC transporter ATP-binding protein [Alphaproteobacteria bacterium]
MNDLLSVRDLKVEFTVHGEQIRAVDGVSFRIRPGGTTALVGESGSGKSVCSQAIMGILPNIGSVAGGEILFTDPNSDGTPVDLAKLDRDGPQIRAIRGGRVSMIFQEPMTSLSPLHTIGDQISEALHLHRKIDKPAGRELSTDMLRLVGFPGPARAMKTYPFELSGGLRQRAMIAMALVCRPALLIADEPTTALDVTIQAQILKLIKDLQSELGMAVLMITHDLGVVANVAEEVVVMFRGKVMESGSLNAIYKNPSHPYLKALLNAVPRFGLREGERLVPLREIKAETGNMLKPDEDRVRDRAEGPLLRVENLSKSFTIRKGSYFGSKESREVLAVDDVSFEIARGECLGLVGESGCGKTTTSKLVMRALSTDSGAITFFEGGQPVDVLALKNRELKDFRRRVQFMFQDPFGSLNPRMTAFAIISEPLVIHNIGTTETRADTVRELMRLVGLDPRFLNRYPHSFSGGQRQRIGIARALALKPDLLICDEPVSALDVSIQAQILNLLKDLQSELGLTYLFISHNLAVVDYIADRIAVMCAGRLVELAPKDVLFRNPAHPYTRALLSAVPEPNIEKKLDLSGLMEDRASDPTNWPAPFTIDSTSQPRLVELADGHFVRADPDRGALPEVA